ncbi:MAG TPA: isoprenylcysteine carboxylmethyltransferase family protein, partial [Planctomycetota bacterium]|nr:isoprenylcysteine carboxylmethyltransferase family protein [Planctomycetota bacterium]
RPALPEGAPLPPTMIAGLLVFAAGTLVAAVAARQLAAAWRDDSRGLCTSGLYAVVRHPMYAGYLLQGAGYSLMLGAIWSWALYGLVVPLLFARILVEDREMAGLFPAAFPAYRGRVRRLVPFIF